MATFTELKARLIKEAVIQSSENYDDATISQWVKDAIARHCPTQNIGPTPAVTPNNDEPVILLAWQSLCFTRASKYVNQTNARGVGSASVDDRTSPYLQNMNMAKALGVRYNDIVAQYATDDIGGAIVQGRLVIRSYVTDKLPPGLPVPIMIGLQASQITPTTADLVWVVNYSDIYSDSYVYISSSEIFSPGVTNDEGIPSISDDAVQLLHFQDQTSTTARVTDMTPNTTSYLILVIKTRTGKFYYSNEIIVVNPAA